MECSGRSGRWSRSWQLQAGGAISRRRTLAAVASGALHLAALALLLAWPETQGRIQPHEALTTIAFPRPSPTPTPKPPAPAPTSVEKPRPARPSGPAAALATPVPVLAKALPIAKPSIAPELDLANGSDARLGGGEAGPGRGAGGSGSGPGGGGPGGEGDGGSDPAWIGGAIRNSDYPREARRSGAEGTVETEIAVDAKGRPSGCTVIASSGSAVLDEATCRLILHRFRFAPARDAAGRAMPGTAFYDQEWHFRRVGAE